MRAAPARRRWCGDRWRHARPVSRAARVPGGELSHRCPVKCAAMLCAKLKNLPCRRFASPSGARRPSDATNVISLCPNGTAKSAGTNFPSAIGSPRFYRSSRQTASILGTRGMASPKAAITDAIRKFPLSLPPWWPKAPCHGTKADRGPRPEANRGPGHPACRRPRRGPGVRTPGWAAAVHPTRRR
jgi:hypothetical protein